MSLSRRSFLGTLGAASTVAVMPSLARIIPPEQSYGRRVRGADMALLNSNENAYGMLPSAEKAVLAAAPHANRYPDPYAFVERVTAYHQVKQGQVIHGYGSSENIGMLIHEFTGPTRKLLTASPTYELPGMQAKAFGAPVVTVPLAANYAHDLDAMLAKIGTDTGLVYICNPNNPTASITPRRDIETFLSKLPKDTYLVIDEAYHHFADSPDYVSFLDRHVDDPRLIILRTFSKVYGMAGMRMGYSVQAEPVTRRMQRWQVELNGNAVAIAAATASLDDDTAMRAAASRIISDRNEFMKQCAQRKIKVIPSQANFVMVETGRPVRQVIDHFRKQNVAIGRPFPPMEQYARISFGLPNEMERFWQAWDMLPTMARQ